MWVLRSQSINNLQDPNRVTLLTDKRFTRELEIVRSGPTGQEYHHHSHKGLSHIRSFLTTPILNLYCLIVKAVYDNLFLSVIGRILFIWGWDLPSPHPFEDLYLHLVLIPPSLYFSLLLNHSENFGQIIYLVLSVLKSCKVFVWPDLAFLNLQNYETKPPVISMNLSQTRKDENENFK